MTEANTPNKLLEIIGNIAEHKERMASKRGEYMAFCKSEREAIAGQYDVAKDAGYPKRSLKAALDRDELRRKMENLRLNLEDAELEESMDEIEDVLLSFETTPLGGTMKKGSGKKAA